MRCWDVIKSGGVRVPGQGAQPLSCCPEFPSLLPSPAQQHAGDHRASVGHPLFPQLTAVGGQASWDDETHPTSRMELSSKARPPPSFLPPSRAKRSGRKEQQLQQTGQPSWEDAAAPAPGSLPPTPWGWGRGDHRRPGGQAPFPPIHGVSSDPVSRGPEQLWGVSGARRLCADGSSLLGKVSDPGAPTSSQSHRSGSAQGQPSESRVLTKKG